LNYRLPLGNIDRRISEHNSKSKLKSKTCLDYLSAEHSQGVSPIDDLQVALVSTSNSRPLAVAVLKQRTKKQNISPSWPFANRESQTESLILPMRMHPWTRRSQDLSHCRLGGRSDEQRIKEAGHISILAACKSRLANRIAHSSHENASVNASNSRYFALQTSAVAAINKETTETKHISILAFRQWRNPAIDARSSHETPIVLASSSIARDLQQRSAVASASLACCLDFSWLRSSPNFARSRSILASGHMLSFPCHSLFSFPHKKVILIMGR
jgi:hypothetical protein